MNDNEKIQEQVCELFIILARIEAILEGNKINMDERNKEVIRRVEQLENHNRWTLSAIGVALVAKVMQMILK